MTPENFCYWLQGFMEIQNPESLTKEQLEEIKNHLKLVFQKVTPYHALPNQYVRPSELKPFTAGETTFCSSQFGPASC